jgi:hypothetical protein
MFSVIYYFFHLFHTCLPLRPVLGSEDRLKGGNLNTSMIMHFMQISILFLCLSLRYDYPGELPAALRHPFLHRKQPLQIVGEKLPEILL